MFHCYLSRRTRRCGCTRDSRAAGCFSVFCSAGTVLGNKRLTLGGIAFLFTAELYPSLHWVAGILTGRAVNRGRVRVRFLKVSLSEFDPGGHASLKDEGRKNVIVYEK